MYLIGLTGGIGSGKTTVANYFAEKNIDIIDTDIIARDLVKAQSPALKEIVNYFGEEVLLPNGELNRRQLRRIIFNNQNHRHWLEQLLHPMITHQALHQANQAKSAYCIIVVPLLLETRNIDNFMQRILVIDSSETLQIQRTTERDGSDELLVKAIMASQVSREERLTHADDVIDNTGDLNQLSREVNKLHQRYLTFAQEHDKLSQ